MRLLFAFWFLLLSGCATDTVKYHWGPYETLIYHEFINPGKAAPELQIDKLQAGIREAKGRNKPVPPGYHAHLGYQYLKAGRPDGARLGFENEMRLYPESSVLMKRFIAKIK